MMSISWKDKVSNARIMAQTQLEKIDLIIKERRLRWFGHVMQMDDNRLRRQAVTVTTVTCCAPLTVRPITVTCSAPLTVRPMAHSRVHIVFPV